MRCIGNSEYMRLIFCSRFACIALLMLAGVQAKVRERIHGDQYVADVCVNLIRFESFL